MSGFLGLANEFIERMMNPAYGPLTNNDYSMRLGELVGDSEGMLRLLQEAQRLERVDELSANTWIWLLGTPQAQQRLSRPLLLELCRQFQAPAFRATVIDRVLMGAPRLEPGEVIEPVGEPSIDSIEDPWLLELVRSAVEPRRRAEAETGLQGRETLYEQAWFQDSQTLLVALLTVRRRVCQSAAAALLHHRWQGQVTLNEFFQSRTAAMDEESRSLWLGLAPGSQSGLR